MINMKLLDKKVAIITGSTRGIGKSIAQVFSEHGAHVVVVARDEKDAKVVADDLRKNFGTDPMHVKADVTSLHEIDKAVRKVVEKYKRIDILVNNAGYPIENRLWEESFENVSEDDVKKVFDVDTMGSFRFCRKVIPVMMRQRSGVIVNISSSPAVGGYEKGAPYTIAKAANIGMTKHIAKEYGKYGIRCNVIAPGTVATKRNWERLSEKEKKELVSSIPFGRPGLPEEIAGVALMLASDYSSFVNGQTIVVDGGEITV
jgi:NAD(P)-dependent dehydrogenase (short-subunit alcohol dehydrogenase family)